MKLNGSTRLGGATVFILKEKGVNPINQDEEEYTKKLKKMCKFSFYWDNLKDFEYSGTKTS